MTNLPVRTCALIACCALCFGAQPQSGAPAPLTGFPFTDEDLTYSVTWPSGINLGEAHLHAKHAGAKWNFTFSVEAGVPGFQIKDAYHSDSTAEFCSASFDRNTVHGSRKTEEKETIDRNTAGNRQPALPKAKLAVRAMFPCRTASKMPSPIFFFTREELGRGRVPAAQKILIGLACIRMTLAYAGGTDDSDRRKAGAVR